MGKFYEWMLSILHFGALGATQYWASPQGASCNQESSTCCPARRRQKTFRKTRTFEKNIKQREILSLL